jgi:hypothetical protein
MFPSQERREHNTERGSGRNGGLFEVSAQVQVLENVLLSLLNLEKDWFSQP